MLSENLVEFVAKHFLSSKTSRSKPPPCQVSTDYSQKDVQATAFPRKGSCLPSQATSQKAEEETHLAKFLPGLSSRETPTPGAPALRSKYKMGRKLECVTSAMQRGKGFVVQPLPG